MTERERDRTDLPYLISPPLTISLTLTLTSVVTSRWCNFPNDGGVSLPGVEYGTSFAARVHTPPKLTRLLWTWLHILMAHHPLSTDPPFSLPPSKESEQIVEQRVFKNQLQGKESLINKGWWMEMRGGRHWRYENRDNGPLCTCGRTVISVMTGSPFTSLHLVAQSFAQDSAQCGVVRPGWEYSELSVPGNTRTIVPRRCQFDFHRHQRLLPLAATVNILQLSIEISGG